MTASAHTDTVVKSTTCYECDANCLFDVTIDASGRAIKVEGLPNCPRGQLQLERQYHPDRLLYPLKRVGVKGSGEFERISWEESPRHHYRCPAKNQGAIRCTRCGLFRRIHQRSPPAIATPRPRLRQPQLPHRIRLLLLGNDGRGKTYLRLQTQNHLYR